MKESTITFLYYITILVGFILTQRKNLKSNSQNILVYTFIIIMSLIIGKRPIDVGTDTIEYYYMFNNASNSSLIHLIGNLGYGADITIKIIFYYVSTFGSFNFALIIISFLTLTLTYKFSCQFLQYIGFGSAAFLFFFICSSFSYFAMQINVIRIGLAMPMTLMFTICLLQHKIMRAVIWGVFALLTHFSTIIPILLILFVKLVPLSQRIYKRAFFIAIILSALGFGLLSFINFNSFGFSKIQNYTSNIGSSSYSVGFKPLFVIYNLFFYFLFIKLRGVGIVFQDLLKYYLAASIIFFMWFQIPFSDRIGAFGWYFIPIISYCGVLTSHRKDKFKLNNYIFGGYYILNLVI